MNFIGRFDNPNLPNILFKAERRDDFISIQTYHRAHGRHGRFRILRDALQDWLDGDRARPFYDADCGDFLVLRLQGGVCKMRLVWLSAYGNGELRGIQQEVRIPEKQLLTLLQHGTPIRRLCKPQRSNARINARPSTEVLRKILGDKRKRRALSKAMRDSFRWNDDSRITLYPDGADSFYFEANGDWPLYGGLVLHDGIVRTPRGNLPKIYYGIHT